MNTVVQGRLLKILCVVLIALVTVSAQTEPLPSWNDGPARKAIVEFVRATTDQASPKFVPPEARIATFDQDGTLWVEHPIYTQVAYSLDRVPAVVAKKPELKEVEPFKTVLSGNHEAIAKLTLPDLEKILAVTLSGMTVERVQPRGHEVDRDRQASALQAPVYRAGLSADARAPAVPPRQRLQDLHRDRWRPGLRARRTPQQVYGIPPEQVVGTAGVTKYGYDKDGRPTLTKEPKLLLNDNDAGKPEGIHLVIGRRPYAGVRQFDRRSADARVHAGWRRRAAHASAAPRRCHARVRLRPGQWTSANQGRHVHRGPDGRGEERRLDRGQHEERLEAHLCVRPLRLLRATIFREYARNAVAVRGVLPRAVCRNASCFAGSCSIVPARRGTPLA